MGFGGGDSTAVCNVLAWQLVVSQLLSAQATPLSHLICLRSSLYSLSARVLPAKREKAEQMKARGEQTVLREGRRVSAHGWPIAAELVGTGWQCHQKCQRTMQHKSGQQCCVCVCEAQDQLSFRCVCVIIVA